MKCFFILLSMTISFTLFAKEREILKCLGSEEKRFHLKKEVGPVYDLNQRLIGEMVQIPHAELNKQDYLSICSGRNFSESWKLLELSITKGKDIFVISPNASGKEKAMTEGMIVDYVDLTKEILLSFISQIQALSPTPTCLKESIPELDKFFTDVKYLQEEMDLKDVFRGTDRKIFEKLKNYPLAFEKCRARLKKNDKPLSTAPAKKP